MQDCEGKKKSTTSQAALPISTLFKPRQVLLNSISNMKNDIQNDTKSKTLISLTNQQRTLLLQSICQFLEQNGFSKTLKNFRKEADVEKESWKSCLLNLEEMCYQFLKTRNDNKVIDSSIKEKAEETIKETKENDGDEGKKCEAKIENESVDGVVVKKKKKKSIKASHLFEQPAEDVSLSVPSEPEKKSKDKKKKKKHSDDPQVENKDSIQVKLDELPVEETLEKSDAVLQVEKEKSKSRKKKEDTLETTEFDKEKKGSKKRKKSSSQEDDAGCVEDAAVDDAKRRKTDNLDQSNGTFLPKTPNGSANGVLENGETESQKKDKSRQRNGSAEPRTSANAFRRVKEEEVEFVDQKLQDNSYWAKDGADSGYGAKAQEVLGQVRGRDFRHEKTKKKRGSYRGGQIDLHSHSFKFNYDEEEE